MQGYIHMAKKKIIINNSTIVKRTNVEMVRNALRQIRTATRNEIAAVTGLSVATSGNILREMLQRNEVSEYELEEPNGGRPAHRYKYNENFIQTAWVGIFSEASIKSLGYSVANSFSETIFEERQICDTITYDMVADVIRKILSEYPSVKSLVVSIPGKSWNGTVYVCDVKELEGFPLEQRLKNDFSLNLSVESECDLITLGYYKAHPELEGKTIATLLAPKDLYLGAGILLDGKIMHGDHHMAGEVSFISSGLKRDDALQNLSKDDSLTTSILISTTAIISIINPSHLIFTGTGMTQEIKEAVTDKCKEILPPILFPEFEYVSDWHSYFTTGIINLALHNTTSGLQLVSTM